MKKTLIILFGLVLLQCSLFAQNGNEADAIGTPFCWESEGSSISIMRVVWVIPSQNPSQKTVFLDMLGNEVFPAAAELTQGLCAGSVTINPPADCQVQNKFYFDLVSMPKTYPANTYYALSVVRLSGDFKVRFDSDPEVTIMDVAGYGFETRSHTNCTYSQSELYVDPQGGQLLFLIQY